MKLSFATKNDLEKIIDFFDKNLDKSEIINEEFLCPFGVKGAINRKQIILLKDGEEIIGALRFYPRKKSKIVSLYQFAFDKSIKNRKVLQKMLEFIGFKKFQTQCFKSSKLSKFLEKQGFELIKNDEKYDFYKLTI